MRKLKSFDSYNEGKTFKANKKGHDFGDKISLIKTKIEEHLRSIEGIEVSTIGNDFVFKSEGEKIGEIMFRDNYIGIRKEGQKFVDELGYNELGKIKFKINAIVKSKF